MALRQPVGDHHIQQLVAVVQASCGVHQLQAVGVAVKRHAVVGPAVLDRLHQRRRGRGTETGVDVQPVRAAADGDHLGTQLVKNIGCHMVGGAMGGIDHDFQALQRQLAAEGALAELDVAATRVFQPARLAEQGRLDPLRRRVEHGFDLLLPGVRQLLAAGREKLDAVVTEGVVRRADHHSQIQPQRPREVSHARGGQRAGEQDVDAGRCEACFQRRLDHVAGDARVFADQYRRLALMARLALEHLPHRMAQAQHEVGRDRWLSHRATNPVGTEIGSAHGVTFSSCRLSAISPAGLRRATP